MSVWTFTETVPDHATCAYECWSWGLNYSWGDKGNPWSLFLDLIGYSGENFGETLTELTPEGLGWVEADKLARALSEWANDPRAVENWVGDLIASELDPD